MNGRSPSRPTDLRPRAGRTVAAVIPTYQRAATIGRAVDSVLAQQPRPRVIVVDDGSTDDTPSVLAAYGDDIEVIRTPNRGVSHARNTGAAAAGTDWIAFCDSDDHWTPDHLARIMAAIEATDGVADVYFDDTRRTAGEGHASLFDLCDFHPRRPHELIADGTSWVMAPRQPLMMQSAVIARDAHEAVGGSWSALTHREDTHLFLRLGIGRPLCAVTGIGCVMTDDDTSGLRQTEHHNARTTVYLDCTARLYEDVLERHGHQLTAAERAVLARRAARARLSLARAAGWRHPARATGQLATALRRRPATALAAVARRLPGRRSHR